MLTVVAADLQGGSLVSAKQTATSLRALVAVALVAAVALTEAAPVAQKQIGQEGPPINSLVEQAIADLARRESVAPSEITLERYEEVTWPDSSLGCPHPGMLYRQVPADGARIVLKLGEVLWEYHSGGRRSLFLCRSGGQLVNHRAQ